MSALAVGAHTLTAQITQADGSVVNSAPVNIVVEAMAAKTDAPLGAAAPTATAIVGAATKVPVATDVSAATTTPEMVKPTAVIAQATTAQPTATAAAAQPTKTAPAAVVAPIFAAAVQGSTFVASQSGTVGGLAAPNTTVTVLADAQTLGDTKTDARGNWVLPSPA